jgi:hypothetical protein
MDCEIALENAKSEKIRAVQERDELERKLALQRNENDAIRQDLERAKSRQNELLGQIGETERAKEEYKSRVSTLKYEKNKLRDEFVEVE